MYLGHEIGWDHLASKGRLRRVPSIWTLWGLNDRRGPGVWCPGIWKKKGFQGVRNLDRSGNHTSFLICWTRFWSPPVILLQLWTVSFLILNIHITTNYKLLQYLILPPLIGQVINRPLHWATWSSLVTLARVLGRHGGMGSWGNRGRDFGDSIVSS